MVPPGRRIVNRKLSLAAMLVIASFVFPRTGTTADCMTHENGDIRLCVEDTGTNMDCSEAGCSAVIENHSDTPCTIEVAVECKQAQYGAGVADPLLVLSDQKVIPLLPGDSIPFAGAVSALMDSTGLYASEDVLGHSDCS